MAVGYAAHDAEGRRMKGTLIAITVLCAAACNGHGAARFLDIATTTSVANSGLTDVLLPAFQKETGITVRLMLAGSGRALQMLARGDVAAAISHAPELEASVLRDHPTWKYRKFMYNDFVIVGPNEDPARVKEAATAREAFRRIAVSKAEFVSRGDESGTHTRERALWREAGVSPNTARLIAGGQGMAGTLRVASARDAYTITDSATFAQLAPVLNLTVLFQRDPALLNTYAVIVANSEAARDAHLFATWLTSGNGREAIRAFRVRGYVIAFRPWPDDQPSGAPCDRP